MKRINFLTLTAVAVLSLTAVSCNTSTGVSSSTEEDRSEEWKALEQPLNFYIANDLGRNGYYDQKPIARTMGNMAELLRPEAHCQNDGRDGRDHRHRVRGGGR